MCAEPKFESFGSLLKTRSKGRRIMEKKDIKIEYLSKIRAPEDLKKMENDKLDILAHEIREELVRVVSNNGGHLASNLGVVELTMAIHRVFETPTDHVIFDVSHQSYVHKMLTGRYEKIDTIRQAGGISGFTKRSESEHDCFGAGHSSTSLSAALGFAMADKLLGSDAYTIAVVGDGAFTGGMIHEALNNCRKDLRLVIILNENEMSISKNTGRFATTLSRLRATAGYLKTKRVTGLFFKKIPLVGKWLFNCIKAVKIFFKNAIYGSNYFEGMGLTYLGPIDGNDYTAVEKLLREAKKLNESVIIHVKTQKGKGYEPAERSPSDFHGMQPAGDNADIAKSFSRVMGDYLTKLGANDSRICAITAAMSEGTGLEVWKKAYPDRFFDVGIAEEHALTFAAGLAANKMRPCTAIYSTFLQRGYDNIIHDIALQKLPVLIAIDRAGLNLKDGATHHGIFDVAFLSHIPNMRIYTPVTNEGLCTSMREAFTLNEPCAIRYPSGSENSNVIDRFYFRQDFADIGLKCDFEADEQKDIVIVTHGRIVNEAMAAADALSSKIKVGIILLEMLKPYGQIAEKIFAALPNTTKGILFLEEEIRSGGMGMNLADLMRDRLLDKGIGFDILATDDDFVCTLEAGQSIYAAAGVGQKQIEKKINELI